MKKPHVPNAKKKTAPTPARSVSKVAQKVARKTPVAPARKPAAPKRPVPPASPRVVPANRRTAPVPAKVEKAHARRGPSTLKSLEMCPGYESREGDSVFSTEGHMLHGHLEVWGKAVRATLNPEASRIFSLSNPRGLPPQPPTNDGLLDEQINVLELIKGEMEPEILTHEEVHFELELDLNSLHLPECEHGTADFLGVSGVDATLVDYKFGKLEVDDPEDNVQFLAYSIGTFIRFPGVNKIRVRSMQPRLNTIGDAIFTRDQMPAMVLRVKTIVERCVVLEVDFATAFAAGVSLKQLTEEFTSPETWLRMLNPQTSLCEWCANIGTCPAVASFALKVTPGPQIPDELDPEKCRDNGNGLGRLFAWSKLLEEKGKALQKHCTRVAQDGCDVDGYRLQNGSTKAEVIDPVGLGEAMEADLGFTKEQVYSCSTVSLEKVEEVVKKSSPQGTKEKAAQDARRKLLDGGFFKPGFPYTFLKKSGK